MVVDDEDELRVAVSKMLRKKGFSVIEASDGLAGVELFAADPDGGRYCSLGLDFASSGRARRSWNSCERSGPISK